MSGPHWPADPHGEYLTGWGTLEFMPYSGVPDLATAWQIVRGVPLASLIIDNWHCACAGAKPADPDEVPAHRIASVQLCDVGADPMEPRHP